MSLSPATQTVLETWHDSLVEHLRLHPMESWPELLANKYRPQAKMVVERLTDDFRIDFVNDYESKAFVVLMMAFVSAWIDLHVQATGCPMADHVISHMHGAMADLSYTLAVATGDAPLPE